MTISQQWTLASRPQGAPTADNFKWVETELPAPADGQVLARTLWMSLDPYMRGRMSEGASYPPPRPGGGVVAGGASRRGKSRKASAATPTSVSLLHSLTAPPRAWEHRRRLSIPPASTNAPARMR